MSGVVGAVGCSACAVKKGRGGKAVKGSSRKLHTIKGTQAPGETFG